MKKAFSVLICILLVWSTAYSSSWEGFDTEDENKGAFRRPGEAEEVIVSDNDQTATLEDDDMAFLDNEGLNYYDGKIQGQLLSINQAVSNQLPSTDFITIQRGKEYLQGKTTGVSLIKNAGQYILHFNGGELASASNNFAVAFPLKELSHDLFAKIKWSIKWSNGDVFTPPSVWRYVGLLFNGQGTRFNNNKIFNIKEAIDTIGNGANLYMGLATSSTASPTHIYQTDSGWHIDGFDIIFDVKLFNEEQKEFEESVSELDERVNDLEKTGISFLDYGTKGGMATSSTKDSTKSILSFDGVATYANAYQWIYIRIPKSNATNKKFIANSIKIKWDEETTLKDVTSKASCFINEGLSFTGARRQSFGVWYDLNEEFSSFSDNSGMYIGVGFSPTFDENHIYQVGDRWHFDPFQIIIDGFIFKQDDIHLKSMISMQLDNGLTGKEIDDRLDALEQAIPSNDKYITCWGDSLTAQGGWTTRLAELTGLNVNNCGIGGEGMDTIVSRQGADAMVIQGITIPADTTEVQLATRNNGFKTQMGSTGVKPLLQGGSSAFNPCKIGGIEGTLRWTGSSYSDPDGTWVFSRSVAGTAKTLVRPETIISKSDMEWNDPYLMTIFMGQNNFGYNNTNPITGTISEENIKKCIKLTNWMINHAQEKHVVIIGLATGNATSNALYEQMMEEEYGRYFISLRKYLTTPVYSGDTIVNCYGLQDLGLTATSDDLTDIANGKVPARCLMDGVHFVTELRPFIGDYIYKRCCELNIF